MIRKIGWFLHETSPFKQYKANDDGWRMFDAPVHTNKHLLFKASRNYKCHFSSLLRKASWRSSHGNLQVAR